MTGSASWQISGQYFETCNCGYICPCIGSNLVARPSEGDCKAALAFRIDRGGKDGVALDGLGFIVLMQSKGPMIEGDWTVGLVIDERATDAQQAAIAEIASGQASGPMAALAALVGDFRGIERRAIRFECDGLSYAATAGELVDQAIEGVPSQTVAGEPLWLDNTCHPVNPRLALAKAVRSRFHAFGIDWDDASGLRNGHFAPFAWRGD